MAQSTPPGGASNPAHGAYRDGSVPFFLPPLPPRRETIEALMRPCCAPFRSRIATAESLDESLELGTSLRLCYENLVGPIAQAPVQQVWKWCGVRPAELCSQARTGERSGIGLGRLCITDVNTNFWKLPETLGYISLPAMGSWGGGTKTCTHATRHGDMCPWQHSVPVAKGEVASSHAS